MKIAVVGTRGFPNIQGGVETHCENLYPRLAKLGYGVIVYSRAPYVNYRETIHKGVRLLALDCPKNKYLETIVHTAKAVFMARTLKPDILHIQSIGPSIFVPLARLLGMRVVVTHHGENYKHKKWGFAARQFLRLCEAVGALSANEIIAISANVAAMLKTKYNRNATVIPNGVEIPTLLETTDTLKQFGLEKGKYILAVGRFVPEKGFHDLIEAFNRCGLTGWKLVIAGRADHEDSYSIDLKKRASRNPNVVLTGFVTGKPLQELYSHAGLFVIPSYYEGLPIVLLEALSFGLQCIASDIPANRIKRQPLAASNSGLEANGQQLPASGINFFRTADIDDLSSKIAEFAVRPMSEEVKRAQIEWIARDYNWDTIAEQTLKVYEKALRAKPSQFHVPG
jgi:glycosyltransferase involved in cell wall biosynthesis